MNHKGQNSYTWRSFTYKEYSSLPMYFSLGNIYIIKVLFCASRNLSTSFFYQSLNSQEGFLIFNMCFQFLINEMLFLINNNDNLLK